MARSSGPQTAVIIFTYDFQREDVSDSPPFQGNPIPVGARVVEGGGEGLYGRSLGTVWPARPGNPIP